MKIVGWEISMSRTIAIGEQDFSKINGERGSKRSDT